MINPIAEELSNLGTLKQVKADRDAWRALFENSVNDQLQGRAKSPAQQGVNTELTEQQVGVQQQPSDSAQQEILPSPEEALPQIQNHHLQVINETTLGEYNQLLQQANSNDSDYDDALHFRHLASGKISQITTHGLTDDKNFVSSLQQALSIPVVALPTQTISTESDMPTRTLRLATSLNVQAAIVSAQSNINTRSTNAFATVQSMQPSVTVKATQTWQDKKLTIIETAATTKVYVRDYRLSDSSKAMLYKDLLSEFTQSGKGIEVTINGKRKL